MAETTLFVEKVRNPKDSTEWLCTKKMVKDESVENSKAFIRELNTDGSVKDVGSKTKPIYMDNGVLTAIDDSQYFNDHFAAGAGLVKKTNQEGDQITYELNVNKESSTALFDAIYPIGSIYMSVSETSPSNLFGGTWFQITNTFLLAAGNSYTAGSSGGEATVSLGVDQLPKHSHSMAHTHTMAHTHNMQHSHDIKHTHGLSSHTHSLSSHTHSLSSHTHDLQKHTHSLNNHTHHISLSTSSDGYHAHVFQAGITDGLYGAAWHENSGGFWGNVLLDLNTGTDPTQTHANLYESATGYGGSHTHTVAGNSGGPSNNTSGEPSNNRSTGPSNNTSGTPSNNTSGGPSNNTSGGASISYTDQKEIYNTNASNHSKITNTGGSTAANTGGSSAANTGETGKDNISINNMPPYLAVYMWKRTA